MHIRDLNGKVICVLGYGREGRAMVDALETFAPNAEITIADQNAKVDCSDTKHWKQLGEGWLENLGKFDVLIKSPGIPPTMQITDHPSRLGRAETDQSRVTSSTQIFFDTIKDSGALTIGVTGSKGKSTTSSLIAHILNAAGKDVHLVGNIGDPAIAHIADAMKNATCGEPRRTIFVIELSSYQLMDLTAAPHIAVITSFFPEHLDYHASSALSTGSSPLEAYREAKARITTLQSADDVVFYADTESVRPMLKGSEAQKIAVSIADAPVAVSDTRLIGEHNTSNIALAVAVARHLKIEDTDIINAIKSFTPLPHRLQSLGIHKGIEWIDDAISTTPESAMAALSALGPRVKAIILGGQDRGNDFTELGRTIDASSIELVILLGESGGRIGKTISKKKTASVNSMEESVQTCIKALHKPTNQQTNKPITLLSPASPSYDMFKNFEEKGNAFAASVMMLKVNS